MFVSNLIKAKHARLLSYALISSTALFLLSLFLFPSFLPSNSFAETDTVTNPSLSISLSDNLDLTVAPGVFSSGTLEVAVSTTNFTGYTLNFATNSSSKDLMDSGDNTLTIPTITLPEGNTEGLAENEIELGYGYSLDLENRKYLPAPTLSSDGGDNIVTTQRANAATNESVTPDTYTLTFGAKVTETVPAGHYANSYTLTATANSSTFYIVYDKNSNSAVGDMSSISQSLLVGGEAMLYGTGFQRAGYGFAGWSFDPDAAEKINQEGADVVIYGPTQTVIADEEFLDHALETDGSELRLYAVWIESTGDIQDWTGCSSMNAGEVTALSDTRDEITYAVAKLADGRCWMIENLRTDAKSSTTNITTGNTNNPTQDFLDNRTRSANWCSENNASCNETVINTRFNTMHYSGMYYNWYTATAGNGTYSTYGNVDGDLCPRGWHLATGGTGTAHEYAALTHALGGLSTTMDENTEPTGAEMSDTLRSFPNNFVIMGNRSASGTGIANSRTAGYYWSATGTSGSNGKAARQFSLSETYVRHNYVMLSNNGQTVRCINGQKYVIHYEKGNGTFEDVVTETSSGSAEFTVGEGVSYDTSEKVIVGFSTAPNDLVPEYTSGSTLTLTIDNPVITLYPVWGCAEGKICYNGNKADEGIMPDQSIEDSTVMLIGNNYSRSGYGFAGWNTQPDGNGTNYGPMETLTGLNTTDALVLYAKWVASAGDLQGWAGCSSLASGAVTALTDTRDGQTYAVAKLADGKCWQIENLRLDLSDVTLTRTNTNRPSPSFMEEVNTAHPASSITDFEGTHEKVIHYSTVNLDRGLPAFYGEDSSSQHYSWYAYGVLYNAYTAMAGNVYEEADLGEGRFYYLGDICPAGWRLSKVGGKGDYGLLSNALGGLQSNGSAAMMNTTTDPTSETMSRRFRQYPNNIVYSGHYSGSTISGRGYRVLQHTLFRSYFYDPDYFTMRDGIMHPEGYDFVVLGAGAAVRCIANETTTYTINYETSGGTAIPAQTVNNTTGIFDAISSTIPTKTGYSFMEWVDINNERYNPGDSYSAGVNNTEITLYAIWHNETCNPSATTIDTDNVATDAVCLQDMNSTVRSTMVAKQTYTLKDSRDNKQYTIAILDDGELWMTQNLNLGENDNEVLISGEDSDIENGNYVIPKSDFGDDSAWYYGQNATNSQGTNDDGVFYTPNVALARPQLVFNRPVVQTSSICPKGWDLPTKDHYAYLRTSVGFPSDVDPASSPYNFRTESGFTNGAIFDELDMAHLWTSSRNSKGYIYEADINLSTFNIDASNGDYNSSYFRENVRCIASNGNVTVNYDANDGTNNTDFVEDQEINSAIASENSFTPLADKQFREWNTKADGTGMVVAPGDLIFNAIKNETVSSGGTLTLYAQWDDVYIMTFVNTNGGASSAKAVIQGQATTVTPTSSFSRSGYKVVGWDTVTNDASDAAGTAVYADSEPITPTEDMTFYTVWRPVYTIQYNGNNASGSTTMTITNANVAGGEEITLYASNFSNPGYGFAGWSLNPNAAVNGSDTIYGPNATINAPAYDGNNTITFYAVWVPVEKKDDGTELTFQTTNLLNTTLADGISTLNDKAVGYVTALRDTRDNDVYAVAKLADGKYWMIENLRLDPAGKTLDSTNTNNPTSDFSSAVHDLSSSTFTTCTTSSSDCIDQFSIGLSNINGATASPSTNSQTTSWYSYGGMYNWYTATAGNGTYSMSDGSTSGDICPTGWHLPTDRNISSDFSVLGIAMGGTGNFENTSAASQRWRAYPNNFVYSGYYYGRNANKRGSSGDYWSSTASGNGFAHWMWVSGSGINPGTNIGDAKFAGLAVRCLAN